MSRSPSLREGEGSLCPASQTLRGVYPERSEWAQGDKRRQAAQVDRPGTSVSVNTYGGKPWPLAGAMCHWHENKPMDGILNINKATGMTSHDVVASIRRLLKQKRVGHAGTLDPAASGVLPICIGQGTRVAEYLSESGKAYRAEIIFGVETDTYDSEGVVVRTASAADLTRAQIEQALQRFTGQQMQLPPRYSAIKLQGKPAYKLARAGEDISLAPRPITIYRLEVIDWLPPCLTLAIECSKGTYIRSLAHDAGEQLGCGAHLAALVRTRSGPFSLLSGCCTAIRSNTTSISAPTSRGSTTRPGASWPSRPGMSSTACGSPGKYCCRVSYTLLLARGGCGTISLSIQGKFARESGGSINNRQWNGQLPITTAHLTRRQGTRTICN